MSSYRQMGGRWEESYSYPNPSTGVSTISYSVTEAGPVAIEIFDVMGRKIQTLTAENKAVGKHTLQFDGSNLPTGTYLYRVNTNGKTSTNRMVITRSFHTLIQIANRLYSR